MYNCIKNNKLIRSLAELTRGGSMAYLLSYERKPIDNVLYDPRLAYSMHLAVSFDGISFTALNHNSGILFGVASENEDGSLNPKTIRRPYIYKINEKEYGILAVSAGPEGEMSEDSLYGLYKTVDFADYVKVGEFEKESDEYSDALGKIVCLIPETTPYIEGICPVNTVEIPDELAEYLVKKFTTPEIVSISVEPATVGNLADVADITACALYTDGTHHVKHVEWNTDGIGTEKGIPYEITGSIIQKHFDFPVAYDRADPCVGFWKGKYYFIATNDADGNHTLYIRESDTISGLVNAEEHLILDSSTYPEIGGLLWAPEFHEVEGKLYIFHAATPEPFFCEESHIMELREGGNPCCREDWSRPKRVVRADGSDICEVGNEITLDMTCFKWEGEYYVIWSQRQFLPKDLGAWLYIAKLNKKEPWKLASDPVVLSKPDYSWENNHTFVDEGPFALIRDNRLFISFSAAAVDTSYVVGLLSIESGKDPLVPSNWKKKGYPILTSRSVEGEYGTGHNAYVYDEYGDIYNTYHGRPGTDAPRSSGIRRVHFDVDGEPVLDLTEEKDLKPEFKSVKTGVTLV